jgi:hypothetical protein
MANITKVENFLSFCVDTRRVVEEYSCPGSRTFRP